MVSVIIPYLNRPELETTLRANRFDLNMERAQVIVVGMGEDDCRVESWLRGAEIDEWLMVSLPDTAFNKSMALNIGSTHATCEHVFMLDADIVLGTGTLRGLQAAAGISGIGLIGGVRESESPRHSSTLSTKQSTICFSLLDGRTVEVMTSRVDYRGGTFRGTGLVCVGTEQFRLVGGMNSRLRRWGWEDVDLLARLQLSKGLRVSDAGSAIHLSHGDDTRNVGGRSPSDLDEENLRCCLLRYEAGDFSGTLESDVVFASQSRVIVRRSD